MKFKELKSIAVIAALSGALLFSSCSNSESGSDSGSDGNSDVADVTDSGEDNTSSDSSEASPDEWFEWIGTEITSLTEEGRQQKVIVVPEKCTEFFISNFGITADGQYGLLPDPEVEELYFLNPDTKVTGITAVNLKKVVMPENTTELEGDCFHGCTSLEEVVLPEGITVIPDGCFYGWAITSFDFDGIEEIEKNAISYCANLAEVNFGDGLKTIGDRAFEKCTSLTEVEIPEGVTSIGLDAFSSCSALKKVPLPSTLEQIGFSCFGYTVMEELYAPCSPICVFYNNDSDSDEEYVEYSSMDILPGVTTHPTIKTNHGTTFDEYFSDEDNIASSYWTVEYLD